MNKLLVPSILISVILVVGIFAFLPVEKASTVHGTIGTDIDGMDRALHFSFNQSLDHANDFGAGTLLEIDSGTTTGRIMMSATANGETVPGTATFECGLTDAGGTDLGTNATKGSPSTSAFTITDGDDILGGVDTDSSNIGGICTFTIVIDSSGG